jgi:hypothetical protein
MTLPCTEHFRAMAYAQLTWRESLRDIEATLGANSSKLYGMDFRQPVRRSTLADANERRDWRIWHDLAMLLIESFRLGAFSLHQGRCQAPYPVGFARKYPRLHSHQ